jgi:hypothetical protein
MPPPLRQDDLPPIRNVFVSSTHRDLKDYRREVKDVLSTAAQVEAYLSEDWIQSHGESVSICHDLLCKADGYFGIFGYWYGSIPPREEKSITHLEFEWALEKWGQHARAPIAVFMPEGAAEKALKTAAQRLMQQTIRKKTEAERDALKREHARKLAKFHEEVLFRDGEWWFVNQFESVQRLREAALVVCMTWGQKVERAARMADAAPAPAPGVSDADLGRLHAGPLAALAQVLAVAEADPAVPGLALLLAGNEDAGQRELLTTLQGHRLLRAGRPPAMVQADGGDLAAFVGRCARALGLAAAGGPPPETVDALAAQLHAALRHQPLVLLVNYVERFQGKVPGFHAAFWAPLHAALQQMRAARPEVHRLVVVALAYTGRADAWQGVAAPHDADPPDCARLVQLPPLGGFTRAHVLAWLAELDVPDQPPGTRARLAARVLTSPDGTADGTPARVFDRLRNETLWPDAYFE